MSGLLHEHHGELNDFVNVQATRYGELRLEYADDPLALEQIDIYENVPAYREHLEMLNDALRTDDTGAKRRVIVWFEEHYPHTTRRYMQEVT